MAIPARDPAIRKRIADLYRGGLPTSAIRERFRNLSATTLNDILLEHNVPRRGRGHQTTSVDPPA